MIEKRATDNGYPLVLFVVVGLLCEVVEQQLSVECFEKWFQRFQRGRILAALNLGYALLGLPYLVGKFPLCHAALLAQGAELGDDVLCPLGYHVVLLFNFRCKDTTFFQINKKFLVF